MRPVHVLLALAVPSIWGFGFTLAKAGLDQFPPFLLMSIRFFISALVLVWFVPPPRAYLGRIFLIALVSATIQYGFTFYGLTGLDASTAILVLQLEVPILALLGIVVLREPLVWRRFAGMVLAFAGVALIAGEPSLEGRLFYVGLMAAGALFWATGQIMIRRLGPIGGFALLAWVSVFAAPQMFVASLLVEEGHWQAIANADRYGWGVILYLALIMTVIGYGAWYHLLGRCEVNQLAPFLLMVPVSAVIGGVLVLGEELTPLIVLGGIVVMAGIVVMTVSRRPLGRA